MDPVNFNPASIISYLMWGGAGLVGLLVVIWFFSMLMGAFYKKVSPNQVLILSGWRGQTVTDTKTGEKHRLGFRVVQGGGAFVIPILQEAKFMSLELITLDIAPPESYTKLGVPIKIDGVAQIKIKGDDLSIRTAAEQFLSKRNDEIRDIAYQTVAGHLRATLGTLTVEEIYSNHETFAQRVTEVSSADLLAMGLTIVSFTIREISDSKGYLEAIGKPQIAMKKRDAIIAEAEMDRDATIRKAQAEQEAQQQRFLADSLIAQSERDFNLKKQEYMSTVNNQKAQTDLAYDLARYKEAQKVKSEEIQVQIIEKLKQTEMEQAEIARKELELKATVEKPALAERQRIETLASAEQYRLKATATGQADAVRAEGTAKAEIQKIQGLANAEVVKAQGASEADVVRMKGLAEAESIKARGLAEAEAMEKRAAAFNQYNEAAVANMFIDKMPQIAEAISAPLSKVEKIVMVSSGSDGIGASKLSNEVVNIMSQVPPVLEAMTGVNLGNLLKAAPGLKGTTSDVNPAVAKPAKVEPKKDLPNP